MPSKNSKMDSMSKKTVARRRHRRTRNAHTDRRQVLRKQAKLRHAVRMRQVRARRRATESWFEMSLGQNATTNIPSSDITQVSTYYVTGKGAHKINFARLEKGLMLFIYIHETTKSTLLSETSLWDHCLCVHMIKNGKCTIPRDECPYEHKTVYRQANICTSWYTNNSCTHNTNCRNAHDFAAVSQYHRYVHTSTENVVCKLIRFVRNFAGHYIESAINNTHDRHKLHKEMVTIMVQLIHALSPKRAGSIDHLDLFLEATTVNQLIAQDNLLVELEKSHAVPKVFLDPTVDFATHWYQRRTKTRPINFTQLSTVFVNYFNKIFVGYYEGRLKSRGAQPAWN